MRSIGIKVLKNKLSEYVRLAASGETILVTDRDTVVAELGPPRAGRAEELHDALLADAVRKGWLRPPTLTSEGAPPRKPIAGSMHQAQRGEPRGNPARAELQSGLQLYLKQINETKLLNADEEKELGWSIINRLREQEQKRVGNKFKLCEFHDKLLSAGSISLPLVERRHFT